MGVLVSALVLLAAVVARAPSASRALALDDGLALTPYMGWSTYLGIGGAKSHQLTEGSVEQAADAMVSRGFRAAGYKIVWIDGGWWSGERGADGNMIADRTRFPDGMAAVANYIHADGLLAGIYTDAGTDGCGGPGLGSYGHYQQDADQFAAWGYDAVKIDFCGGYQQGLDPRTAYTAFSAAIRNNSSGRPMLIDLCNPTADRYHTWRYAPPIANSWRTDNDVGTYHDVPWSRVVRNLDSDALHPGAAGPGSWNDPDYLGPEMGMTPGEAQAQLDMWAIVSAPLMIGTDVRTMSNSTVAMLTNPEVIAIDQDVTGGQGTLLANFRGLWQVWVKQLAGGQVAVALLNRGPTAHDIRTSAAAAGLAGAPGYALRDVVAHTTTFTSGVISATVPANSAALFRVSPTSSTSARQRPAVTVTAPRASGFPDGLQALEPGREDVIRATVADDSPRTTIGHVHVRLSAPAAWRVTNPAVPHRLSAGESTTLTWHVRPPKRARQHARLHVVATYTYARARTASVAVAERFTVRTLAPVTRRTFLSDVPWIFATSTTGAVRANTTAAGEPLTLRGHTYAKGVFAHSVASVDYWLGGGCSQLSATLGVDDSAQPVGSVRFIVWADSHRVYRSPVLTPTSPPLKISLPVGGAHALWIRVTDGGDGAASDYADLAAPILACA